MYFVVYKLKGIVTGFGCETCESLGEAKEFVEKLYEDGYRNIKMSKEIPMKVKLKIEL